MRRLARLAAAAGGRCPRYPPARATFGVVLPPPPSTRLAVARPYLHHRSPDSGHGLPLAPVRQLEDAPRHQLKRAAGAATVQ